MSVSTLLVVHHETNHDGIKQHVSKLQSVHGELGTRYQTYKPVHGPASLSYVWVTHENEDEAKQLATGENTRHLAEELAASALNAKDGVKGLGSEQLKTLAASNSGKGPSPFVLAVGVKAKPGKMGQLVEAGKRILNEHEAAGTGVRFSIHQAKSLGEDVILCLLHLDSLGDLDPDGPVGRPLLIERLGADAASEVGAMMADAVEKVWQEPLRHLPHLSAA